MIVGRDDEQFDDVLRGIGTEHAQLDRHIVGWLRHAPRSVGPQSAALVRRIGKNAEIRGKVADRAFVEGSTLAIHPPCLPIVSFN
jgi:hypothetical protein